MHLLRENTLLGGAGPGPVLSKNNPPIYPFTVDPAQPRKTDTVVGELGRGGARNNPSMDAITTPGPPPTNGIALGTSEHLYLHVFCVLPVCFFGFVFVLRANAAMAGSCR